MIVSQAGAAKQHIEATAARIATQHLIILLIRNDFITETFLPQ
ncbi:hypothetical protein BIFDEN_01193 [Bifidobacterium dentium ATCC 27678]|nr:hypothetical protein BIFDEN_01193 [Bifidobacterium dentium ATCC 27678]